VEVIANDIVTCGAVYKVYCKKKRDR